MGRIQYIETSQEWICPETGTYKVICVGGGCGYVAGSTTSFGTYLSARGGDLVTLDHSRDILSLGGTGGYTINGVYGGSGASIYNSSSSSYYFTSATGNGNNMGSTGIGYGAGGGILYHATNIASSIKYGKPGELKTDILTLTKDDAVACTVGTGGLGGGSESSFLATAGADGVIIIEFLGTEA